MNAPNPGQPAAPAPQPGQLIRPQMLNSLKFLDPPTKARYQSAIAQYWSVIDHQPQGSEPVRTAISALKQITEKLKQQHQQHGQTVRQQQQQQGAAAAAAAAGAGQAANAPTPQNTGAAAPAQTAQSAQSQAGGAQQRLPSQQNAGAPAAATQQGQAPNLASMNPKVVQHVKDFPWIFPPDKPSGTPEGDQWLKEIRTSYLNVLDRMDKLQTESKKFETYISQKKTAGQEVQPEIIKKKEVIDAQHALTKQNADKIRNQQNQWRQQRAAAQQGQGAGQVKTEAAPSVATAPQGAAPGKPFNLTLPRQPGTQSPAQNQAPNNAMANANTGGADLSGSAMSPGGQAQPLSQQPTSFPAGQQQMGMNSGMQHPQGMHAQRPSLNTAQVGIQSSPVVPQSAGAPPAPLSHRDAMARAARTYSDPSRQQLTPGGTQQQREYNSTNAKMPIPKTLPPSVLAPPMAVNMGMTRPTLAGPLNGAGGMMGQPVIERHGNVLVEGDGTNILSKDKLAELVREVGGPDETITPEVEEILLSVADEFIDNVITAACRLAKLRDSAELQIRDIQTVLERNYNIRIPGYSLDETRVIRKFAAAPGWHQKVAAINAAKVVSGKGDI